MADSGSGTLREAITFANAASDADTITFAVTGTITLASNLPQIANPLTIIGPGTANLTITGTSSNTAFSSTTGTFVLDISGLTLSGLSQGVFTIGKTLSLTDMIISSMALRSITTTGGSLDMTRVTVSNNAGLRAVYPTNTTVMMTNSTISGSANIAMEINGGTATITGSTFANNTASGGAGAIYANGTTVATVVNIINSTFSGNSSTSTSNADAIYAYENATVDISFSTFSGHSNSTATSNTGIIHAGTNADIVLWASIIANNPAGGTPRECTAGSGATFTASDNLTNDTVCTGRIGAPTNVSATLASNGGLTQTHALLAGSNAIDAYTGVSCPATDQRGQTRPAADTDCDLGAYEIPSAPVCPTSPATIPAGDVDALIFAIECANASPSDDVINLSNSTYTLEALYTSQTGLPPVDSTATAGTLTINGNGATISGNNQWRPLWVRTNANVALNNLTLSGGYVTVGGGAILNNGTLTLTDSIVSNSRADGVGGGGGIQSIGMLTLIDTSIFDNTALSGNGGGINNASGTLTLIDSTVRDNEAISSEGGGIRSVGTLTVTGSTISGNTAGSAGGGISGSGTMTLTNSTISTNSAQYGGGITNVATMTLNNATLSGNTASGLGDGIYNQSPLTLNNTILANPGEDCYSVSGTVDANYTLFSNANACGAVNGVDGNIVGVNPLLGTLTTAPNGTTYYPLNFASPAIDAGSDALIPVGVTTDQAGNNRIRRARVDMGAFESDFVGCPSSPATIPAGDVAALIFAIECANASPSNDVINLTNSTYTLTATHNTATGPNGLPVIADAASAGTLTINGSGATISGNNQRRAFYVEIGAIVTLGNLTITNCRGGGIDNRGTLTLTNVTVSNNESFYIGGGIGNKGTLMLIGSTVSGNTAYNAAGGIGNNGTLSLTNSTVSGNTANASGGGIFSEGGTLTVTGSTISGNTADGGGGGGIYLTAGTLTLIDSIVSDNTAFIGGGIVKLDGILTLTGSTVSGNTANVGGGIITDSGTQTLNNVTISGNTASDGNGGGIINSSGTLTLNNVTVYGNTASGSGDGIYSSSNLTLNNTILANTGQDCVSVSGTVDANYTLFSNANACGAVNGVDGNIVGADPLFGTLTTAPNGTSYYPLNFASPAIDAGSDALIPVGVTTDQAGNNRIRQARVDMGAFESDFVGCPVFPATIPAGDVAALIFAIECANASPTNDVINLSNSTYTLTATHNTTNGDNGLPAIASAATAGTLTISGNGATISGNNQRRVIYNGIGANLMLNNLTVSGGFTSVSGGGIYNLGTLTLTNSTVSGSTAAYGGGIYNSGTLTVTSSTVSGNTANGSGGGGGIFSAGTSATLIMTGSTVSGNAATYFNNSNGGGIVAGGTVTLTGSTVIGNTAIASGGGFFGNTTLMTLNNSTISDNTASAGGGFFSHGTVILNNSTVTGNTAVSSGGGFYNAGTLTVNNTILAINTPFDCVASINSIAITMRHSLINQQHSCGVVNGVDGNIVGADPLLGTLTTAPNGTSYYSLLTGSPAINSGSNALVPVGLDFDQAGNVRIQGDTVDMGAFETNTPAPAPEIDVTGNSVTVADGDTSPVAADHTDFGTTTVGTPVTRTFTIQNTGTGPLTIDTFTLPSGFVEAAPSPALSVAAGGSTALNVQCEALSFGVYTGDIVINSNDADENPYTFSITCQVDHAVPAGITITETNGGTAVTESGDSDTYTVALDRVPSADVTVTLTFGGQLTADGSASPVVLTFTPVNWETAQDVTVAAVNDSLVEGTHTAIISQSVSSADADYNALDLADISVSIADNDTAEVIFPASAANVSEDITPYSQNAVLSIISDPVGGTLAGAVTVQLTQTAGTALTPDDYMLTTASLTFPAGSASGATQPFSVDIVDDALEEPDETFVVGFGAITGTATATGTHTVTILDDDIAGITVTETAGSTAVTESGDTDTYTITLSSQPTADVTVTLTFDGQITADGSASPAVLTFTPLNWATAQDVTVAAVNDSLVEGAHSAIISQSVSSADADYNVIGLADISVSIADNDTAEVIFPASAANVSEDITPYSQNAVLSITSDPVGGTLAGAVTVQLTQTAGTALTPDDYTLTTASLTFPAGSVSGTTQLYEVDIVDDALEEPDETFVVGFGAVTGPATASGTHTVTILANDAPVCPISPATIPAGDVAALIFAIECANASLSDDVIELTGNSTYTLTANHNTTNGPNGLPQIASAVTAGTLTINGNGAAIDGNDQRRVLSILSGANVTLNNITIANGLAGNGAGIRNYGTTTLNRSTIRDNTGTSDGGGFFNWGTLTVVNGTITGNTSGGWGGGIANGSGTLTLKNTTIAGNTASSGGGLSASGTVTVHNSILSANTATASPNLDCVGTVTASHSLFRTGSCGVLHSASGNRVGTTPALTLGLTLVSPVDGSPAYYTIAPGSAAANTGDNALVPVGVTTDQPGNPRIQAITVDMGSYEVYAPACPVSGDTIPAGDVGMLIYAIECANASPSDEMFELTNSTYALTGAYNFSLNGLPQINTTTTSGTLTINGNGAIISGSDTVRIFEVGSDGDLTLNDMTLTNGRVTGINSGGAISVPTSSSKLTLNGVAISASVAGNRGGAIYNFGEITVSDSVFSGNTATDGGAIYNARTANITGSTISDNTAATGGGFYATGTTLNLTGSTVADNISTGSGGGFYVSSGAAQLYESTVSGNTAQGSGAGFFVNSNADVGLYNSTVTDNTATVNGGALFVNSAGSDVWLVNNTIALNAASDGAGIFMNNGILTVRNSIVATNESTSGVDEDCYRLAGTANFSFNLFLNGACGAVNGASGNVVGADPLLGTLTTASNGTNYYPLLTGSPAINAGENALVPGELITDQAGNLRIQGGTVDLGAFETDTPAFVPEINVTGNGVDIASGDATPDLADHTDFGTMLVGAPVTRAFTIHNTGTGTATLTINSFTLPSGFVEAAPAPSMEIPAGGSTTLNVQCEATWADTYSGTVTINTNDADESAYTFAITCLVDPLVPEINVTGSGVDISSGDTTPSLVDHTDFGTTPAGTPLTRTFTIENSGTGDLNLSGVVLPSGFSIVSPLPDPVIAAGGSAALNAQCDAAASGIYFGTVEIYNDDADESVYEFDVACMVNGPEIEVYGNAVLIVDGDTTPDAGDDTDFGTTSTGMPVGALFSILNMGNEALTIDAVTVPSGFTVIAQPAESVPAGTSTALEIRCTAAVAGSYSGAVTLSSNDFDENPYTFDIACGVNAPDIDITGNGITIASGDMTPDLVDHTDFGMTMVGVPVTRTFTIENHGDGTLNLFTVESTLTGFVGTGGLPAFIIPTGGSTTVSLECQASAAGTYGGTFGFTSNDPDESPYIFAITCQVDALTPDITITGNGVTIANGDISPSLTDHTDFGSTTVGTPVTRTFTIHNNGDADLHLTNASMPSGFMSVPPVPSTTIAAGESTSFGLQCPAAAVGVIAGMMVFESDDPDSPSYSFGITCDVDPAPPPDINITGNGVTIANGDVTPDLSDHTDFGVTTVGTPVVRTFTIENTGSGVLNLTGIVGTLTGYTGAGDPPALTIPAGGSTTFSLECEAVAEGTYGGTFGFTSDDPDESPYTFAITCQVTPAIAAGVTITQTGGTTAVTEAGGTDTYSVVLDSQPTADVLVTLTFDGQITANGSTSPVALTFTPANWNMSQTVTVAAVNDPSVEGAHSSLITQTAASADAAYNVIDPADVNVSMTDNDTAAVGITLAPGSVFEGSPYFVNAVLSIVSDPVGGTLATPVTVLIGHSENTALNPEDYDAPTASVTFPANSGHFALQLITTQTVDDALDEPDETFTLNFGAVTGPATASGTHEVTILDNDSPGVSITETDGTTAVTEAGGTDTYTVVLDSQPTADVTITLTFDGQITANGSASPVALTFNAANWNVLQTVTVAAANDSLVEGAHSSLITQTAASADTAYNAVDPADVVAAITDNDTAEVLFPSSGANVAENLTPYSQNAVLSITSDPAGGTLAVPVTVGLLQTPGTAAAPDDYTLTTTSLTFPVGSANAATQLYEVSIVNDALDEPDETFTLSFGAVTGPSTTSGTHTVTILDNDSPGVTVTESGGTTAVTEAGGTDTYTVVLDSQPTADVTITLTFDGQITVNGQASPVALTFSAANWNVLQTVTVAAVNDSSVEGAHNSLITQTAASADAAYNAVDPADVIVSITDNDTASIAFETASGSATEGTSPYTVNAVLSIVSDPVGGTLATDVQSVITHTAGTAAAPDDYVLTTVSITFPAGAANGAVQPVSVSIVDDPLSESDETFDLSFGAVDIPVSGTHTVTILASDQGNLLQNHGFETAGTGVTKADKWASAILTSKDKRVCNTVTKTFSNSGVCAFRFQYSGLLTTVRSIKQTVKNPAQGRKGENYTLDAMISASNLTPGTKLILMVKYGNGTKAKAVINVPSGSYAYTPVETVLPITRKVTWVRVILSGNKASGRLLIDDLVLWVEPGTPATDARSDGALLPPPAAPDGFRGSN